MVDFGRRYTIEEYEQLPEELRVELVRGRLVREPEPGYLHGRLQRRIGALLDAHLREQAPHLTCVTAVSHILSREASTVRGPDVAVLRRDRLPSRDHEGFVPGAPELAVEISSPSMRPGSIRAKLNDYFAAGTRVVWVVNARQRSVTVHEGGREPRIAGEADVLDGGSVLRELRLPVAAIFED